MTPIPALSPLLPPLWMQCPRCMDVRQFATQLGCDPHGWSKATNEHMAAAWLKSHPCRKGLS